MTDYSGSYIIPVMAKLFWTKCPKRTHVFANVHSCAQSPKMQCVWPPCMRPSPCACAHEPLHAGPHMHPTHVHGHPHAPHPPAHVWQRPKDQVASGRHAYMHSSAQLGQWLMCHQRGRGVPLLAHITALY